MPSAMAPASASTSWGKFVGVAFDQAVHRIIEVAARDLGDKHWHQQQNDRRFDDTCQYLTACGNDQAGRQHAKCFAVSPGHADQVDDPADTAAKRDAAQRLCAADAKQQRKSQGPDNAHAGLYKFRPHVTHPLPAAPGQSPVLPRLLSERPRSDSKDR